MKKILFSAAVILLYSQNSKACGWYDPDYEYFNLFTQSIIKDKTYLPFLLTYSNRFYGHEHYEIPDENIETWQKFFGNKLNYQETKSLIYKIPMSDLNAYKKGNSTNPILSKLGTYQNNHEAIDYLIEAKYLEPYMQINYVESPDSFYYRENENPKNATQLDYNKTVSALTSLYNAAKNPEIKLRYGYQLVRFNHYTRNYPQAVEAFSKYVEPLNVKSSPYFWALDQLAGAQRGLNKGKEANWNFFKVFMNSKSRRESAFTSMKLSDSASFKNIMDLSKTAEEKNMAYFLLAYDGFNNPLPMMEKMHEVDPNSELLKVMAARAINQLERSYLKVYYPTEDTSQKQTVQDKNSTAQTSENKAPEAKNESFWDKISNFFRNLFGSKKENKAGERTNKQSDKDLLNNPNRIPFYTEEQAWVNYKENTVNFIDDLEKFIEKTKDKSPDEFWQIADAYVKFLNKNHSESNKILSQIKTQNPEYAEQINRMKMLNEIVSQPKITPEFEDTLYKKYASFFTEQEKKDSTVTDQFYYPKPSTSEFLKDVLANRYFLQGEDAKSYLMNNKLSFLQYSPNSKLVKSVEEFYRKPNKNAFEQLIAKNLDDVGNKDAFFNLIYGDREMKLANFDKAKEYYQKVTNFSGIPRVYYDWDGSKETISPLVYKEGNYNGFKNISSLVFGHNVWESFESPKEVSMKAENLSAFPFIKSKMDKLELVDALVQLKKMSAGNDATAAKANQLIGNLMYNTSVLGYFRELFVMDIDNSNGGKFNFWTSEQPYQYYYKNFMDQNFVEPDNFNLAINYYQKALNLTTDKEQKARILFQMASAEQGKYYQYEAQQPGIPYDDKDWEKKQETRDANLAATKNQKYRTYFTQLKNGYADTETARHLMGSCSYFGYFMKRK